MATYSLEDKDKGLSDLVDRALAGEGVVITREGRPVAEIRPLVVSERPVTEADLAWLEAHRVGTRAPHEDSGTALERQRDEDWR